MWDRFKKRVDNWIFEDIDEDDDKSKEQNDINDTENYSPDTKMVYQYPKQSPFRFPVIEDKTEIKPDNINDIPAYKRRQLNKRTSQQQRKVQQSSIGLHQITKRENNYMQTLEDIPAYMRREREEKVEQEPEKVEEELIDVTEESVVPHTSPDELDAIFKKRNHLKDNEFEREQINNENDNEQTYNDKQPILNHIVQDKTVFPKDIINPELLNKEGKMVDNVQDNNVKLFTPDQIKKNKQVDMVQPDGEIQSKRHTVYMNENEVEKDIPHYLLDDPVEENREEDEKWIKEQTYLLERTLKHFNVKAEVVNATQGSSVTRFEVRPDIGVKVSRIRNLVDDIKLNMAAKDIRIEAPIPGRHTVGIEVPNKNAYPVGLQEIIQTDEFNKSESPLTIALGLTIEGESLVTTIGKMPHCLIAGATGSGKSVCINTILLSLMYKASYEEVKFLLIDPKMVELAPYNGIPYLISPVITDVKAATASLKWAVNEMERRYELFADSRVRDISRYNTRVDSGQVDGEKMPYIVIVIDELADLMMASPQDVEDAICRIAQKARACGIHLLLATQRPSVDVITGLIKANIPTRISFSVTSQVDSRTIIDTNGAEKLLGKGDMLFVENGSSEIVRLQGPFVSDDEIERVTSYIRSIGEPNYLFEQEQLLKEIVEDEEVDELLEEVIQFVMAHNQASTSLLQRQFRIGYNRAARLIDTLEARGIISGQNGTKPRDVLMTQSQLEQL